VRRARDYPRNGFVPMFWAQARGCYLSGGPTLEIEGILAIIFVLGVPSLALATHVVLRPLIREYAKLKGLKADKEEVELRMARLEDVVYDIDRQVNRLLEAERFRRELESGRQQRSLPEL